MDRRQMISGVALSALAGSQAALAGQGGGRASSYLEIKTWRLHNSPEEQTRRVSDYVEHGLFPALQRAGAKPVAALGNLIGPDGPSITTLTQFASLGGMQDALSRLERDVDHERQVQLLNTSTGPSSGVPFVRLESSLVKCFASFPETIIPLQTQKAAARVFEWRIYESQSLSALRTKAAMFESGEIGIFQRLGMQPVFFGETIVGPRMPCIQYMLSFDTLAERERLWSAFGADPEWKKMSAPLPLKDAQIVGNISNTMLHGLAFSPLR